MNRSTVKHIPQRAAVGLVVVLAIVVGACGGGDTGGTSDPPGTTEGPVGVEGDGEWGPLAVVPPADGSDGALIQGTLRVTEDCVLLSEQGDDVLLVWPADRTIWSPDVSTVSFLLGAGQWATFADGDRVTFGGGGSSTDEGGLADDDWVAGIVWVSEPDAACVTDTRWFVGAVVEAP